MTCDDDVDGAAGIAGHVAGRASVFTRTLIITRTQLHKDLFSIDTNRHLVVVRPERFAVLEPRHAKVTACTAAVNQQRNQ